MITQYILKRGKIVRGIFQTLFNHAAVPYQETKWWDCDFYTAGINDAKTISAEKSPISARYHYASVELLLTRHLRSCRASFEGAAVLDIGSGSGHWVDFYRSLGAGAVTAVDVSAAAVEHLRAKYAGDDQVKVVKGTAKDAIAERSSDFNYVNAIGVMFHIIDDEVLINLVNSSASPLAPGGLMVIGGHFGIVNRVNIQVDRDHRINKRLRSRGFWRQLLRSAGLHEIRYIANNAYLHIEDTLPENNRIIGRKPN